MVHYKKKSIDLALDMVNKAAQTTFTEREVEFKDVSYLEDGLYNTRATLYPKLGGGWQSPYVIEYDRVNVQALFKGVEVCVKPLNQKKVSEYLPLINERYGIYLTTDDIEDGIIPDTPPPFMVGVKIHPSNPAFYGQFELLISNEDKSIRRKLEGITFTGIPYPTDNPHLIQGPIYTCSSDWSALAPTFSMYVKGDLADLSFVNALKQYDEANWVYEMTPQPFNLFGAKVTYHGLINRLESPLQLREGFDNVLILKLDPLYCKNMAGELIFHYNKD